MTSYPFNKYEQITPSYLLSVKSVMIYEQFVVSIVELIMLSWQPILSYNFHDMRVTWLFYHFFKQQVHVLHGLENVSNLNIWKM